ncbi:hypothetical protein [Prolixibacter sp. SD074]|uniref:hypothetical protein n=1 Tax=Prolixibacter sp. SD074 TaxID=2652391 RepID=UPI0012769DBD|nr:hypothetical protein [Prolixibacter sp. SD074]GET30383.1 hypothetical protein SD074_25850 [Prolixibacter sp. SD074]
MKKQLILILFLTIPFLGTAQSTQRLSFNAILQNDNGTVPENQSIKLDVQLVSAVNHSQVIYEETQTETTNNTGYLSASIGNGTVKTGNFDQIDWSKSSGYLFHITAQIVSSGDIFDLGYAKIYPVPLTLDAQTVIDSSNWYISGNHLYTLKNTSIGSIDSTYALAMRDNGRMRLQTDQAELPESALIIMKWPADTAKTATVWYDKHDDGKIAMVAHYYLHYPNRLHQHFSIECEDDSGFIQTRVEFPWGNDTALIATHNARMLVNGLFSTGTLSGPSENDIYANTWIYGTDAELNIGTSQFHTGNYPVTIQANETPATILLQSKATDKRSILMLRKGDNEWNLDNNDNLFRVQSTGYGYFMHFTQSGKLTFDDLADTSEVFNVNGNITVNQHAFISPGTDSYAEYMPAEETLTPGDIAGIDPSTGKIRKYQDGDFLAGIVSSSASRIGNAQASYIGNPGYALVTITGTTTHNSNGVVTSGKILYTSDNQRIGIQIATGKVLLK